VPKVPASNGFAGRRVIGIVPRERLFVKTQDSTLSANLFHIFFRRQMVSLYRAAGIPLGLPFDKASDLHSCLPKPDDTDPPSGQVEVDRSTEAAGGIQPMPSSSACTPFCLLIKVYPSGRDPQTLKYSSMLMKGF
jgi:hypothetical protein